MLPGMPGIPPPIGDGATGGGAITGGDGAGIAAAGGGDGMAYGPPAHAPSPGMLMHAGSAGPVGTASGLAATAYGPPWHTGSVGMLMHARSSGPVGAPGLESPGAAFAGRVTPVAAMPARAVATAAPVIALRIPEAILRFIHRSFDADPIASH